MQVPNRFSIKRSILFVIADGMNQSQRTLTIALMLSHLLKDLQRSPKL